jgi:putative membrane protein
MEAAGFADIEALQLDDQGIWRGRATSGGQQVTVMLDYQGNIGTR